MQSGSTSSRSSAGPPGAWTGNSSPASRQTDRRVRSTSAAEPLRVPAAGRVAVLGIRWGQLARHPPLCPGGMAKKRDHSEKPGPLASVDCRGGPFIGVERDFLDRDQVVAQHRPIVVEKLLEAGRLQLAHVFELIQPHRGGERFPAFARVQSTRGADAHTDGFRHRTGHRCMGTRQRGRSGQQHRHQPLSRHDQNDRQTASTPCVTQ